MVEWQLCTLEHLMNSRFGRPFPRHGLQLLYWFANCCVTFEMINFVVIMKLVSDCQPENGFYGFHSFGNIEELLPVLDRPRRRKAKRKVEYYEVGNLNTETYPSAANLPTFVRENYDLHGNRGKYNTDRIIISYQMTANVVETVYITEHDGAGFGRFSPDGTYEISPELIQALQSPHLDLTTFLTQMGYYGDIQIVQANDIDEIGYPELSVNQMFNTVQTYSGSTTRTAQIDDFLNAFKEQLWTNAEPFNYDQQLHYIVNVTSHSNYGEVQHKHRKPKATKRPRALRQSYWPSAWEQISEGYNKQVTRGGGGGGGGGGFSFFKILLSAGALYLAAKCFSWLASWWKVNLNENTLKMIPWRTPSYRHTHIMLDYVY
nr:uncharacterized protein LOC124065546 isoform X2 [Scatophagus argus]